MNNLNAIQNSASVSVASGATLQANLAGTYANSAAVSLVGNGVNTVATNNAGALHFGSGGTTTTVWNAPLTLGGATRITSFGVTMNQTLGGAITGTGPLTISSRGGTSVSHTAEWTLGVAASYTGNTNIVNDDGLKDITVKLGIANALPTTTSLNLSTSVGSANPAFATLDLNGFAQTLAGLTDTGGTGFSGGSSNKRVINSSGTLATLTLNIASGTSTYGTTGTNITAGTIGGTTAGGAAANNLAVIKDGAGTMVLGGANTYTGGTTVSVGTLRVGNATALGANASAVSVTSGAVLDLNGITMNGTNALSLNGSGIGGTGALINSSSSTSGRYAGTVTLGSASTIGTTGTQFLQISDGTNSVVNLNGFLLTLKGNGTVAAAINIPRGNGITGAGGVTVDGAYLDLRTGGNQSTNTYSGTTTLQNGAGILHIGNFSANSNIVLNGGVLDGYFNSGFTRALGTGATQVQILGGASGFGTNGSANINLGGASAQVTWGSAFFSPSSLILGTPGSSAGTTTFQNPINLSGTTRTIAANSTLNAGAISGVISNSTGTAGLTKTGVGQLNLTSTTANTYNGGTTISLGTLLFDTRLSMPATGDVSVASGATLGVTVASTGTTWGSGTGVAGIAGLTSTANTGGTGFGGQVGSTVTFAGNSSLFLNVTGVTTESNVIGNGGATNLTLIKSGASTLTLSGNNSHSGGTTLSAGILALGHDSALGSGTLTINGGTTIQSDSGTARSFANAVSIGGDFTVGGTGNMTFSNTGASNLAGNRTITVTTNGVNATFAQAFNGTTNVITKAGAGTLTLSGNNTHTGGTTLTGGTLVAFGTGASTTALGTGALTWGTTNTTLEFRRDGDMSVTNTLATTARSLNRTLVVSRVTSGAVNLAFTQLPAFDCGNVLNFQAGANVTGTPTITFSAGTNSSDSNNGDRTQAANSATGPITFNPTGVNLSIASIASSARTRAYFLSGTSTGNQITGVINNGTGTTIDKTGSGTWTLSGANLYSGSTTISGGKLTISAGNINATSGVSINGGEFNYNSGTALTKAVTFTGTGGTLSGTGTINALVTTGGSASVLSPGNSPSFQTYSAGLNVSAGTRFKMELSGDNTTANASDKIIVTGGSGLVAPSSGSGALVLDLYAWGFGPAIPNPGVPYTLVTYTASSNLDAGDVALGSLMSGLVLDSGYGTNGILVDFGGGGGAGSISVQFSAVPEPTSLTLLGLGGMGLLKRRRRR